MSLRDTQATFYGAISNPAGNDVEDRAVELIKNIGRLSALQRLDIYRNTALASKIKTLQQIYPVCESILGKRIFSNIAYDYAASNASLSNNLDSYGEEFSAFIEDAVQTHNELTEFLYLTDLCQLEWLWHKVYYQDNNSPFDFEDFAIYSQKPNEISLTLSSSLEIMASDYPIHLIWQQHRDQQQKSIVTGLDETEYLCIYRQNFVVKIERISKLDFALLKACRQGRRLGDIADDKELSAAISALPEMIKQGWISGFTHHAKQMKHHV